MLGSGCLASYHWLSDPLHCKLVIDEILSENVIKMWARYKLFLFKCFQSIFNCKYVSCLCSSVVYQYSVQILLPETDNSARNRYLTLYRMNIKIFFLIKFKSLGTPSFALFSLISCCKSTLMLMQSFILTTLFLGKLSLRT